MREQRNDPKRLKGDNYLLEKGNNVNIYGDHILIWKWHN